MRDRQVPDEAGRTIPSDVTGGQLQWSLKQEGPPAADQARQRLALIGRSEQVDIARGLSSSYACQNCCPDSYYTSYLSLSDGEVEVDATLDYNAMQQDVNCYGGLTVPYERQWYDGSTSWNSSDTQTATVNGSGVVTAVGAGETIIRASWTDYIYETGIPCEPQYAPAPAPDGDEPPRPYLPPSCGVCQDWNIYPNPSRYLAVRPRITIKRNGNAVTSAQNVIVGQQMDLSATVTGGTPSAHQWTIPGTTVANYVATCTLNADGYCSPTSGTLTPLASLSGATVKYYWVDGADNRQVRYTVTIRGRQYPAVATFNVKRPTAQVSASTGAVQLTTWSSGFGLWFGNPSAPGIVFTRSVTMPSGFNGDLQWVQTWNKSRRVKSGGTWFNSVGSGLDSNYPYSTAASANDSPGLAFGNWQEAQINDGFDMWLMFKPTGVSESTIWVPLRKVSWGFSGHAVFSGGTWQLVSSSQTNNPADANSTTHPTWTSNPATIPYAP